MSDNSIAAVDATSNLGRLRLTETPPRSFNLFSELCTQYGFLKNLSTYLSIADLVALTRTHRDLSDVYKKLLRSRWNIDKTLCRFVSDPKGFRSQMASSSRVSCGRSRIWMWSYKTEVALRPSGLIY